MPNAAEIIVEPNKDIIRAFVDAINQRNWHRFDELVAPDFMRHSSTFGAAEVCGRDELREYLTGELKTFPDAHERINFMLTEGDKVAVHSDWHGTQQGSLWSFPSSGKGVSAQVISIYRVSCGQIAEAWVEWDCLSGLIQLGHLASPVLNRKTSEG